MIPLKGLKTESNIMASNGASSVPFGDGILSIIALSMLSTPSPVFPLAGITSSAEQPIKSII